MQVRTKKPQTVTTSIRLPKKTFTELKHLAKTNYRSANAEIVCAIDERIAREKEAA